ncbi:MAG: AAA family ATPase, partial [Cyanobacteria bacterium J06643_5]
MFLDLASLIHQIIITPAIQAAHRNDSITKILKKFNLDLKHPEDFDSVYAYALVKYAFPQHGEKKSKEVLQIFRLKEIKEAFKQAFYSMNNSIIKEAVDKVVHDDLDLNTIGKKVKDYNIDLHKELQEFYQSFLEVIEDSKKPKDIIASQKIDELQQKIITEILKLLDEKNNFIQSNITGFEALIKEKTRSFCGRKFVFEQFDKFIKNENNPNGYFVVVGDAGMGKSAIAAKYVSDNNAVCFFNVLSEHRNTPDKFLKTIRQQLINRYQLHNVQEVGLSALITKVAEKIHADERLVIVVDALDEVEQKIGAENILYLPETLPEKVYFLLTRRPY